jgi:calcium-dependent protein kinase
MHDQHRVVHCDLKPDNILFVSDDEKSDIKIIDFGMSKVLPRLRSLRELCGTPYYTAPEIINGDYSHAADMWSIGVIAYVMILGFPPFYVDPNKYYGVKETKEIYKLILKGFDPHVKKGYGAWFPRALSNKLSKNGMDFMANLMEKDVAKRLTAQEALLHPWIQGGNTAGNQLDPSQNPMQQSQMNITALQFANFATSHKFKFAITALFRDQYKNMRPKHFENLKQTFKALDKDGNGKISYEEFEEGMLKSDLKLDVDKIKTMFKELDVTQAGEIEFENLLNAAVHDYLVASDVRLYRAFRDLDENESGKIETHVLKKKIRDINPYGNVDMILQIIDDVDLDNDGTIDYEEFLRALHPDFNETPNWFWKDENKNDADEDPDSDDKNDDSENKEYEKEEDDIYVADPNDHIDSKTLERAAQIEKESSGFSGTKKKKLDPQAIVKQGYMQKEGKMIKSWRRRWFVLQNNGVMSYYHNEHESTPLGRFNVKQLTRLLNKSWSKSNKKRYGIKVYTPHRNWKFLLINNQQRLDRIKAFETVSGKQAGNKAT